MIIVVATVRVHKGREGEYEAALGPIMADVRAANPGILFYHTGKAREEPQTYRVIEAYADQAAMDAHVASERLQASLGQLADFIADLEIRLHDCVA
ncbi:MAG: antibiotic biosynthesis monooxygenase [Sphingomonadaceae bacterium]